MAHCCTADNTRKSYFTPLTKIFFTKILVTKRWVNSFFFFLKLKRQFQVGQSLPLFQPFKKMFPAYEIDAPFSKLKTTKVKKKEENKPYPEFYHPETPVAPAGDPTLISLRKGRYTWCQASWEKLHPTPGERLTAIFCVPGISRITVSQHL